LQPEAFNLSFAPHEILYLFEFLLEVKANITFLEPAIDEALPILHIIDLENDSFEMENDSCKLNGDVIAPELMLLDYLELPAILEAFAAPDTSLEWDSNLLLECGVDHVLELLFRLDLFIENPKCDVLEVGKYILLVIDKCSLPLDVHQLILPLLQVVGNGHH
jgi:hypothetical protein